MNCRKTLVFLITMLFASNVLAAIILPAEIFNPRRIREPESYLGFQIIKAQFVFNNKTVEKATIIKNPNGKFEGLEIELKPKAAELFSMLTEQSVGKQINFILENKIVSSPIMRAALGKKFKIVSIKEPDAQLFLRTLTKHRGPDERRILPNN